MKKRTIAIIITAAVILAMMPIPAAQAASGPAALSSVTGSSLEDDATYTISTQAELAKLATLVNGGETCSGNYFIMTSDITVTNDYDSTSAGNWTPIGDSMMTFKGCFCGQNHKISGLDIRYGNYSGLFGNIGIDGVVTDLSVDGAFSNGSHMGGIAGVNSGNILNCTNNMAYTGGNNKTEIGGIAGENMGLIRNCRNYGNIAGSFSTSSGDTKLGGIAGNCYFGSAQILDCCNYGSISANENAGGIVGCTYGGGSSVVILNCSNTTGSITANNYYGGIIGTLDSGAKLENCYTAGTLGYTDSSGTDVGTVGGILSPGSEARNCFWLDDVNTEFGEMAGATESDCGPFESTDMLLYPVNSNYSLLWVLNAYVSTQSSYFLRPWISTGSYPVLDGVRVLSSTPSVSVAEGKTVNLTVLASGQNLTYKWQVRTKTSGGAWTDLENGTAPVYTTPAMTAGMDGNQYQCVVTSGTSTMTSSPAVLVFTAAPNITKQPEDCAAKNGDNFTFTIDATGTPTPSYKWYYSGDNGSTWNNAGCSEKTLTQAMSSAYDGRLYRCVVSNNTGNVTSDTAGLYLPVAPHITVQAENKTAGAGNTATFSVTATGRPVPTYQWQVCKDGSAWGNVTTGTGGDTASYTTEAATSDMNGYKYRCVATNSAGNDTSTAATLTVNIAPNISGQPGNQSVKAGNTATFSVSSVTGNPAPAYQWQVCKDGSTWNNVTTGTGGDTASYTTEATTAGMNGYKYRCVATNSAGNDTSSVASLTVSYETLYIITADSGNAAYGSVSGGGSYLKDASVTLTATANAGYYFVGWYSGTTMASSSASYTFSAAEDISLIAQFDKIGIPGTITASSSAYNKITVSWSSVAGAKGYYVYRATAADGTYKKIGTSKKASYVNSGVTTGATYYYKVAAYTKSYTGKYYSAVASAASALGKVTKFTAKSSNPTKTVIKWKAVTGAKKYQVLRSDTEDGVFTAVKTTSSKTITDTGLIPGNTYYYKVVAYRGGSYSADSDIVSVTTKAVR